MAAIAREDGGLSFTVASVMEDVLQQHGSGLGDHDLESRRAEEAASRRYEAANSLRKMVGVVGAKDLPAEPTEEGFRLGLRSGIILCKVLNKVHPGAVSKVVESPCDAILDADSLRQREEAQNMRVEMKKLDEEMDDFKRKNNEEQLTIHELESELIKRRRRAEKCSRLAEAQCSYRNTLEKMIRE